MTTVFYEQVAWMRLMTDRVTQEKYYLLGNVNNMKDTFAVSPVKGIGGTRFFCKIHERAYKIHEVCEECRSAVREDGSEAGVTACNTPEIQR